MRTMLYMATVTITHHNPAIRAFYTRLYRWDRPQKVAFGAAMCERLVILNAVIRDQTPGNGNLCRRSLTIDFQHRYCVASNSC